MNPKPFARILLFVIFAFLLAFLAGCSTSKQVSESTRSSDSITKADITRTINKVEVKKGEAVIPGSRVDVKGPLDSLIQTGVFRQTDGNTTVTVTFDKQTLEVKASAETQARTIPVDVTTFSSEREEDRSVTQVEVEQRDFTKDVEVDAFKWYDVLLPISLLLFILFALYRLFNR